MNFSFNSPFGACPECFGIGCKKHFDEELKIPDKRLTINEGAIQVIGWRSSKQEGSWSRAILEALAEEFDFSLDVPFESYPKEIHDILLYGTDRTVKVYYDGRWGDKIHDVTFKGIISSVEKYYRRHLQILQKLNMNPICVLLLSVVQGTAIKERVPGSNHCW